MHILWSDRMVWVARLVKEGYGRLSGDCRPGKGQLEEMGSTLPVLRPLSPSDLPALLCSCWYHVSSLLWTCQPILLIESNPTPTPIHTHTPLGAERRWVTMNWFPRLNLVLEFLQLRKSRKFYIVKLHPSHLSVKGEVAPWVVLEDSRYQESWEWVRRAAGRARGMMLPCCQVGLSLVICV